MKSYDDLDEDEEVDGCVATVGRVALRAAACVILLFWLMACATPPPHELHVTTPDGKVLVDVKIQQQAPSLLDSILGVVGDGLKYLAPYVGL